MVDALEINLLDGSWYAGDSHAVWSQLRRDAPVGSGEVLRAFFHADTARPFLVRVASVAGQKGVALNTTGQIAETIRAMRVGQAVAREVASSRVASRGDCRTF